MRFHVSMKLLKGLALVTAFAAALAVRPSARQGQPIKPLLQRVATLAELRAVTAEEIARAEAFDISGLPPITGLVTRHIHYEPGAVIDTSQDTSARPVPERAAVLTDLVCSSDAVIVGRASSRRALLSARSTTLFTDSTIAVERWTRPKSGDASVLVSAEGGAVDLAGQIIQIDIAESPDIGQLYVLYLRRFPKQKGFTILNHLERMNPAPENRSASRIDDAIRDHIDAAKRCSGGY